MSAVQWTIYGMTAGLAGKASLGSESCNINGAIGGVTTGHFGPQAVSARGAGGGARRRLRPRGDDAVDKGEAQMSVSTLSGPVVVRRDAT